MKSKSELTLEQAKHIAALAKLDLTYQNIKKLLTDLSAILDLVNKLQEIDTSRVSPTSQVTGLTNIYREDVVTPSLTQEEALSNSKKTHKGYFVVPAIFD